jgi:hypothetical protein
MPDAIETKNEASGKPLQGVGGWLLVFVLGTFANVLFNLVILLQGGRTSMGGQIRIYNPAQLVLLTVSALAAGVALLTLRNRGAVLVVRVYLGLYLVSNLLVAFFGLEAPSGYYIIDREGLAVRSILQAVLINAVWQTYFARSQRVRTTYPASAAAGAALPAAAAKSLAAVFDRKKYGVNFLVGAGFFLGMLVSGILWTIYDPLVHGYPAVFPSAGYFLAYRIPLLLVYSALLVLLLHSLRNDWLAAALMGLGTMVLGQAAQLVFRGTVFGAVHMRAAFDPLTMVNGFLWSFFLVLGIAFALRTWGLRWWSLAAWSVFSALACDLIVQVLYALARSDTRIDLLSLPMDIIEGIVVGSFLYWGIMLHVARKKT